MKKILLFLFMCFAIFIVQAQIEVTIGSGSSSTHDSGPIYVSSSSSTYFWSNHISIFTPTEIGASDVELTGFSWNKANAESYTLGNAEFKIYVKHTSASTIPSAAGTFASELVGATLVYESTTQNIPATTGWIDFNCNTANSFVYNGTDNLMILVDWYRPGAPSAGISWHYSTASGLAQTWSGSSTPPSINYGTDNRPNIKIRYIPSSPLVTPSSASITCGDTAVFTASGSTGLFAWYGDSLGNHLINTDSVLSVGPLCSDATVYAAALEVNGVITETYNFTSCGLTGSSGPTIADVITEYSGTNLEGRVNITSQGIQEWVVPVSGIYTIEALGGQGYGTYGGRGAYIAGDFLLNAGDTLKILVGQKAGDYLNYPATTYNHQFGGGGGSFVTFMDNTPLVVAGGGGGNHGASYVTSCDGQITNSGADGANGSSIGIGGTGGIGGLSANSADGGGGLLGNGIGTAAGIAFVNGGQGGSQFGFGGFGGGGGTSSYNNYRGGGGGGYSGGGGSNNGGSCCPCGGGGGSYNGGINQYYVGGANTGDGTVNIYFLETVSSDLVAAQISVSPIAAPIVTSPVNSCEGDSVILTTSGSTGNFYWFADSLGTTFIDEGTSIETSILTSDTVIYVQAYSDSMDLEYYFTPCDVTGRTGPTQTDVDGAYQVTILNDKVNISTQGIQEWIVPYTATYTIEVAGAQGGGNNGGMGANIKGDFALTTGDTLKLLVGQMGTTAIVSSTASSSGGGGSFVTLSDNTPLIIAGGGGGNQGATVATAHGSNLNDGQTGYGLNTIGAGGTSGNGGIASPNSGGGGGLLTNGTTGANGGPNEGGHSFLNGGEGGDESIGSPTYPTASGGFGGGGTATNTGWRSGGGGGGYSGGGGGNTNSVSTDCAGGGGGSYNTGTNQSNTAGINTGHGYVIITVNAPLCKSDIVPIEINVDANTGITTQPVNVATTQGSNAIFTISATGAGLTYQWQESTDSAATWADLSETAPYSGVTTTTLTITGITPTVNNNYYRCLVSGTCGADTSDAGILTITNVGIGDYTLSSTSIYPNPVSDILIVEVDNRKSDHIQISVFDLVGKLVIQFPEEDLQQGINTFQYNMEALANGVYYLEVRVDLLRKLHKLVKE